VEGEPVPIEYGARLGGQAGRYELGFLQVGTARTGALPSEGFTVARIKRAFFEQSTIGAIYTRRATGSLPDDVTPDDSVPEDSIPDDPTAEDRHTLGVDLDFSTRGFLGDKNLEFEAFVVWSSDPEPGGGRRFGDLSARGLRVSFPNDVWDGHLSYREFGAAYDPAVGFVTRNDFRRIEPRIGWQPRPAGVPWIRSFDFSAQFRYLESLGGGLVEERQWELGLLGIDFESGDRLDLNLSRTYEYLDEPFEVAEGIEILPGGYTTWETTLRGGSAQRRPVSVEGEIGVGDFWRGTRRRWEVELTVRPAPGFSVSGDYELNQVALPQGGFETNLVRLNGGWDLSPWASATGSVQYDDVSDVVGLFGLARWIVRPGNEIYLVYTHNWQRLDQDPLDREFATLSRGASVKVTYSWRW
jgi:hypothetical protein